MALTDGLIALWKLDETSGNIVSSVPGIPNLSASGLTYAQPGKINTACSWDGSTSKAISTSDIPSLNPGAGDYSLSGWIYMRSDTSITSRQLIGKRFVNTGANGWYVGFFGVKNLFFLTGDGTQFIQSYIQTDEFPLNSWHMWTCTFTRGNPGVHMYVDGVEITGLGLAGGISDFNTNTFGSIGTTDPVTMGLLIDASLVEYGHFDGLQDEIGYWNRALSPSEVSDLWNGGAGVNLNPAGPATVRGVRGWSPDPIILTPGEHSLSIDHNSTTGLQDLYVDGVYKASRYVSLTASDSLNYKQKFERKAEGSGSIYVDDVLFHRHS